MWIKTETGMPVNLALAMYIRIKDPSNDTGKKYQIRAVYPTGDEVVLHSHSTAQEARALQAGIAEELLRWGQRQR